MIAREMNSSPETELGSALLVTDAGRPETDFKTDSPSRRKLYCITAPQSRHQIFTGVSLLARCPAVHSPSGGRGDIDLPFKEQTRASEMFLILRACSVCFIWNSLGRTLLIRSGQESASPLKPPNMIPGLH